jgi:D-serine deaminase-like pyridoxal phosphate-dependent protein
MVISVWRICVGVGLIVVASAAAVRGASRVIRGRCRLAVPAPPLHVIAACSSCPVGIVDADAFAENISSLVRPVRAAGKAVRIATKSVRSVELVEHARRICEDECGVRVTGIMTFTAAESLMWARRRTFSDILLGYPAATARAAYDVILCNVENPTKVRCSAVVDCMAHVELLVAAAADWIDSQEALVGGFDSAVASVTVPVVVDVDMGWRPAGGVVHVGVRRSPLRTARDVSLLVRGIRERAAALAAVPEEQQRRRRIGINLVVVGLMGYEAQIAGLPEHTHHQASMGALSTVLPLLKSFIKKTSAKDVLSRRQEMVAAALAGTDVTPGAFIVNGGGSGSVVLTSTDLCVTEVTIGSGMLCGHLFDGFQHNVRLSPCLYFALPVCRVSDAGKYVTVSGGGWVASGPPANDRLPLPVYPSNALQMLPMEGAGEVQTPLEVVGEAGKRLAVGDAVIFRPAKSGELGEVLSVYRVVSAQADGSSSVNRLPSVVTTYRGADVVSWA